MVSWVRVRWFLTIQGRISIGDEQGRTCGYNIMVPTPAARTVADNTKVLRGSASEPAL
jgi:hypothetical protein